MVWFGSKFFVNGLIWFQGQETEPNRAHCYLATLTVNRAYLSQMLGPKPNPKCGPFIKNYLLQRPCSVQLLAFSWATR